MRFPHLITLNMCCKGTYPQGLGSRPRPRNHPQVPETWLGTSSMSPEVPAEVPKYRVLLAQKQETLLILGTSGKLQYVKIIKKLPL